MNKTLIGLFTLILVAACTKKENEWMSYEFAESFFSSELSTREYIVYCSRGGNIYGMDSDTVIRFYNEGRVELTEYGNVVSTYEGSYEIDSEGRIVVELLNYNSQWPLMCIVEENQNKYLYPIDRKTGFVVGGRVGAAETPEMKPFWPFGTPEMGKDHRMSWFDELNEKEKNVQPDGALNSDSLRKSP